MDRFTKGSIIKERLLNFLKNHGNERKQINFLKDCLINSGYMKRWNEVESDKDEEFNDDGFKEYERLRLAPEQNRYQEFYDYNLDLPEGDIVSYASGIEGTYGSDKLQKIQQRGITHEEQLLGIVNDLYENALSQIGIDNVTIKNQALNMYRQLLNYYQTNAFKLKINKGSLKKGYFGMILYYALINNSIIIKKNVLTTLLGIELKDLPEAEKNIKLIFKDQSRLFSTNIYEINLCNMKEILPKDIVENIYDVISSMKETFGDPLNQAQVAACIYYVCKRNKTKINNKLVTYDMVSKNCDGNPTSKTIKENVDLIKSILGE